MSRIAEYKIVDYKTEQKTIPAQYDEAGELVAEATTEEIKKPIYALVYRDMTEQEEAEMPMPSVEEIKAQLIEQVQNHLDSECQKLGYDNGFACASYIASSVPKFKAEAECFVLWRDQVWSYCYEQLALYEQGEREIPTDIIAELPVLEW